MKISNYRVSNHIMEHFNHLVECFNWLVELCKHSVEVYIHITDFFLQYCMECNDTVQCCKPLWIFDLGFCSALKMSHCEMSIWRLFVASSDGRFGAHQRLVLAQMVFLPSFSSDAVSSLRRSSPKILIFHCNKENSPLFGRAHGLSPYLKKKVTRKMQPTIEA